MQEVLANFTTDKYGLDCGLELEAKVFQLSLNNVSRILALEGYEYSGHAISAEARDDCWSATFEKEVNKVLRVLQT